VTSAILLFPWGCIDSRWFLVEYVSWAKQLGKCICEFAVKTGVKLRPPSLHVDNALLNLHRIRLPRLRIP
jgi:hypothetical protein